MGQNWPYKTEGDLTKAGYKFERRRRCYGRTCGAEIEEWRTPGGKMIPLDAGTLEPHFATCPDVEQFRR